MTPLRVALVAALAILPLAQASEDIIVVSGSGVYGTCVPRGTGPVCALPEEPTEHVVPWSVRYEGPNGGSAAGVLSADSVYEATVTLTQTSTGLFALTIDGTTGWSCVGRGATPSPLVVTCTMPRPSPSSQPTPGLGSASVCRRTCAATG